MTILPSGLITPRFPNPTPKYDRENEAQYRQAVERTLRQLVGQAVSSSEGTIVNSFFFDPDNLLDVGYYVDGSGTSDKRPRAVNAGTYVRAPRFLSDVATGTAPFTVASTTKVVNLNADLLDDQSSAFYQDSSNQNAGTLPSARLTGAYTGVTGLGTLTALTVSGQITSTLATGTAPLVIASTTLVSNLTAQYLGAVAQDAAFFQNSSNQNAGTLPSARLTGAYAGITGIGTLVSGAVPASLVTAGTFGAGAYTFPSSLEITGALTGVTTLTTSGAINGQTISSAASFTGTATFAGAVTNTSGGFNLNAALGGQGYNLKNAGVLRAIIRLGASATNWEFIARDTGGAAIDTPIIIALAGGGTIAFASGRPVTMGSSLAITGALSGVTTLAASGVVTSTLATGTAPFTVASTTKVANLNADLLDDQTGSYYLDNANATGTLGATLGGTAQSSWTLGDLLYASASNTLSKLAGNTTTTPQYLRQTGNGSVSAAPVWDTLTAADVGAGNFPSGTYTFPSYVIFQTMSIASGGIQIDSGTSWTLLASSGTAKSIQLVATGSAGSPTQSVRLTSDSALGTGSYLDLFGTSHANAGRVDLTSGASADLNLTAGSTIVKAVTSDLSIATVGYGLKVKEGTNATMGVATLAAGTVVVNTTKVTANSRVFITSEAPAGTIGFLSVSARTAGTSFTITSSNALDTSTVAWLIVEPA